ncbi:MAG: AMP-binding protein [Spongiibacteraceae bacterium]|jgi:acyl-coenzyme A synthetase/AMP-(fatty) acid ligase/3-hydroxymyristoyl/3-hydroxydecanoyl-(acyl carrier protein) dehydratase|nr:AMP-binding protein [Spongiibacteraceae bacterium]
MSWTPLEQWLVTEADTPQQQPYDLPDQVSLPPAALRSRALQLAAGLQQRRITRLVLQFDDASELAVALLGAWRAGATPILAAEGQLPADAELDCVLPASEGQQRSPLTVLGDRSGTLSVAELLTAPLAPAPLSPAATLLLCTSGSSGRPKLILKRLHQLSTEVRTLHQLWGTELAGAVVIGSVAAHHIYGLLYRVLWPLAAGVPFMRIARPFPEEMQQASAAFAHTVWVASPALLKRLGDAFDFQSLRGVRRIFSSGGALPAPAAAVIASRGGQWPLEIYGSSETGGIGWRQGQQPWQPFPGITVSCDARGALQLASPYLPDHRPFVTADAVTLHSDGRFELGARLDRIVKLEDKRISLPQIEQRLCAHPWVVDARLGVLQERRAFLGAVVALSPAGRAALRTQGRRAVTGTLREWLAHHTERLALPRRWRLVRELPFTAQDKLPAATLEVLLRAPRPRLPEQLDSVPNAHNEWTVQLRVPLDLAHFSGHFPGTPVLPGVVQISWALTIARQLLPGLPPRFGGMEVIKFQRLARPDDQLELQLRWDEARGKLYFSYRSGAAACSSGRILLGASHDE